ncbi:MAG: CDP-4-dehydro-6-deoxyglucose reductase, partial [Halothiobacillaceae bacterium]
VVSIEDLGRDILRLYLAVAPGATFAYQAGEYVDLILQDGKKRTYSIANAPVATGGVEFHIRDIEGGLFAGLLQDHLAQRREVTIEGPYGAFNFNATTAQPLLLLAGGTGFAPIKALVEQALTQPLQRPLHLYWGARTQADLYLDPLVRHWATTSSAMIHYTPVLSDPEAIPPWYGRVGYLHEAVLQDFSLFDGVEVYASGPLPMVKSIYASLVTRGLRQEAFYSDIWPLS